jgi:hypothetical protein
MVSLLGSRGGASLVVCCVVASVLTLPLPSPARRLSSFFADFFCGPFQVSLLKSPPPKEKEGDASAQRTSHSVARGHRHDYHPTTKTTTMRRITAPFSLLAVAVAAALVGASTDTGASSSPQSHQQDLIDRSSAPPTNPADADNKVGAYDPTGVHLALGDADDEMSVTWATLSPSRARTSHRSFAATTSHVTKLMTTAGRVQVTNLTPRE